MVITVLRVIFSRYFEFDDDCRILLFILFYFYFYFYDPNF